MKIITVILLLFITQVCFQTNGQTQETGTDTKKTAKTDTSTDTGKDSASSSSEASTATGIKKYEGQEGEFVYCNSSVRIFTVRYYDRKNPHVYDDITFFYDENTKVEYKESLDVDDLRSDDKVKVYMRITQDETRHFNISRSADHMADRIVVVERP